MNVSHLFATREVAPCWASKRMQAHFLDQEATYIHFYIVTLVYPDFEDTVHFICKVAFFYQNTLLLLHIY